MDPCFRNLILYCTLVSKTSKAQSVFLYNILFNRPPKNNLVCLIQGLLKAKSVRKETIAKKKSISVAIVSRDVSSCSINLKLFSNSTLQGVLNPDIRFRQLSSHKGRSNHSATRNNTCKPKV